jgi:hypothetical protein
MACIFLYLKECQPEDMSRQTCHCKEELVGGKRIFHQPSEEELSQYCNGGILENDNCPHMIELLKWGEGSGVTPFGAGSSDIGIGDGP